jgi:hypothetical protein
MHNWLRRRRGYAHARGPAAAEFKGSKIQNLYSGLQEEIQKGAAVIDFLYFGELI